MYLKNQLLAPAIQLPFMAECPASAMKTVRLLFSLGVL
jgi:hypothetical protein